MSYFDARNTKVRGDSNGTFVIVPRDGSAFRITPDLDDVIVAPLAAETGEPIWEDGTTWDDFDLVERELKAQMLSLLRTLSGLR